MSRRRLRIFILSFIYKNYKKDYLLTCCSDTGKMEEVVKCLFDRQDSEHGRSCTYDNTKKTAVLSTPVSG